MSRSVFLPGNGQKIPSVLQAQGRAVSGGRVAATFVVVVLVMADAAPLPSAHGSLRLRP